MRDGGTRTTLWAMPWQPPVPLAASTLAELRSTLGTQDRLVGYDAILDALSPAVGSARPVTIVRAARWQDGRFIPCIVAVLEDVVMEGWLDGREVVTATTGRPRTRG